MLKIKYDVVLCFIKLILWVRSKFQKYKTLYSNLELDINDLFGKKKVFVTFSCN